MQYRKFKADKIFDGRQFLKKDSVLVTTVDGEIINVVQEDEAGEDIEVVQGVLSPGFINCHCHLELSHLKNIFPEKTGLVDFVTNVITQRHFAEDVILNAIDKGEQEMFANGIVAVGDICNTAFTIHQKQKNKLNYHNFVEVAGWNPQVAQTRFEAALLLEKKFRSVSANVSVVPHAPYSISETLWKLMKPLFTDQIVTLHNQETAAESDLFVSCSGRFMDFYNRLNILNPTFKATGVESTYTSVPYLQKAKRLLLVHNTFMNDEDVKYVQNKHSKVSFCLCPNANLYIEDRLPPLEIFMKNNCHIVLGTDSLASNHALSILDEMKILLENFPAVSQVQVLQWATFNGAEALCLESLYGSFTTGKKPGIINIDTDFKRVRRLL